MTEEVLSKVCKTCNTAQAPECFAPNRRVCRACSRAEQKAWRLEHLEEKKAIDRAYYLANSEKIKARSQARYAADPEAAYAASRERALANPERSRAYSNAWASRNREAVRLNSKAWALANPDKRQLGRQRRRALNRDAFVEDVSLVVLLERDGGICGICKTEIVSDPPERSYMATVDHIIPLVKGGLHSYANTQPAHLVCNLQKGVKILDAA